MQNETLFEKVAASATFVAGTVIIFALCWLLQK
jgi:hypothetical protein